MRRAVNLVYLHLLRRIEHAEGCTQDRCARLCDVAKFHDQLAQPLLLGDVLRQDRDAKRLAGLAKGEIPRAG